MKMEKKLVWELIQDIKNGVKTLDEIETIMSQETFTKLALAFDEGPPQSPLVDWN